MLVNLFKSILLFPEHVRNVSSLRVFPIYYLVVAVFLLCSFSCNKDEQFRETCAVSVLLPTSSTPRTLNTPHTN